jgi:hypothetical protein
MFTTITSPTGPDAISVQPGGEYLAKLALSGKGYVTVYLNESNGPSFYRIIELVLSEGEWRYDLVRRFQISPSTTGISLMIEHRGESKVKIESAILEKLGPDSVD